MMGDPVVGDALVSHDGIDAITFTGSTGVGRKIAATAAAHGVPMQAEMGARTPPWCSTMPTSTWPSSR